jgi:hypothetical protein
MRIQAFLTAVAVNLKRLAGAFLAALLAILIAIANLTATTVTRRLQMADARSVR